MEGRNIGRLPGTSRLTGLDTVFFPGSIAVVGVSEDEEGIGAMWVRSLIEAGFDGRIYAVGKNSGELNGYRIWPGMRSLPEPVDLVIVCIPRAAVLELLYDCIEKKVKCVQFYTAGFSETGEPEWVEMENRMVHIARNGGFRIIGPNCFGVYNPGHKIPYGPFNLVAPLGSVGLIVQSGGIMGKVLEYGMINNLGFGKGISLGNGSDLGAAEILEYLALDDGIKTIGLYLEGPKDARRLFDVMRAVDELKPIVVWKGGSSPAGERAVFSHTGGMAASASVWSAALRQAGAIEVHSLDELCDTLLLLDRFGRLPRANIGAICGLTDGGGGEAVLISDICAAAGIQVPPLQTETSRRLTHLIGQVGSVLANPVDVSQHQSIAPVVRQALDLVAADPQIDIIMVYENAGRLLDVYPREVTDAVNQVFLEFGRKRRKPTVLILPPGPAEMRRGEIQERFKQAGVPVFPNVERAARAIKNISG